MKSSNNSSERKPPWPFKRPPNKCGVFCIVLGILFLSNAMLSTFFRIPLSNFLGMYIVVRFLALVTTMVTMVDHGNHRSNDRGNDRSNHCGYYDRYYNVNA